MTYDGRSLVWFVNPVNWFTSDLATLAWLATIYSVWNAVRDTHTPPTENRCSRTITHSYTHACTSSKLTCSGVCVSVAVAQVFVALDFYEATRTNETMIEIMLFVLAGCGGASIAVTALAIHVFHLQPMTVSPMSIACMLLSTAFQFIRECWYVFEIVWIATHWQIEEENEGGIGNGGYHVYAPCIFLVFRCPVLIVYALFLSALLTAHRQRSTQGTQVAQVVNSEPTAP